MSTEDSAERMASTARRSASSLLPRPCSGAAASAAASVTRSSSRARLRSMEPSDISLRKPNPSLTRVTAPDRKHFGIDHQVLLVYELAVAGCREVDTCPLQHRGHCHRLVPNGGLETLEEDLVFSQRHLTEPPHPAKTSGGSENLPPHF